MSATATGGKVAEEMSARQERPIQVAKRIPRATYRLQLNQDFPFPAADQVLDYLRLLGISDCYVSPIFKAAAGSAHGYDVCGYEEVSPALGTAEDFAAFCQALRARGMGLVLDMVPNHMGNELSNQWWREVLEQGPDSAHASWFDIDWNSSQPGLSQRVLLPVLEGPYSEVLEQGKLRLLLTPEGLVLSYYDRHFPLSVDSYAAILRETIPICCAEEATRHLVVDLETLLHSLATANLASTSNQAEFAKVREQLREWCHAAPSLQQAVTKTLERLNGRLGDPASFDKLHEIIEMQHYRLAHWRVGPEEINYRRFFDVTALVCLRMEMLPVFKATHVLISRLLCDETLTGVRVDHPDGLWDPRQYFERLQQLSETIRGQPLYVVVEKILSENEALRVDWPVDGTTGYDFLNEVNGLFIHSGHDEVFDRLYRDFSGFEPSFSQLVRESKKRILDRSLISEISNITQGLRHIAGRTRYGQDFTFGQLLLALKEIIAQFPVYRTYLTEETASPSSEDRDVILKTMSGVQANVSEVDPKVLKFIENILLLKFPPDLDYEMVCACRSWIMKFQQITGPVMAKGLEDTAFYNYNRLISLNEVGGSPGRFGQSVPEFHGRNSSRLKNWPNTMLASATHDTKRGEDGRLRINVLSEMPDAWRSALTRWQGLNQGGKRLIDGILAPSRNDEYFLYQTLIGVWPPEASHVNLDALRARVSGCLLKAIREAKAHTTWTEPNSPYEEAVAAFISAILRDPPNPFLEDFSSFVKSCVRPGICNSLAQLALKTTSPGVPDFYQGSELWDLNLVDPDNRRPVDFALRRELLKRLKRESNDFEALAKQLTARPEDPSIKLYTMWRLLGFRNSAPDLFRSGGYVPLDSRGPLAQHVVAFARCFEEKACITVVPRLILTACRGGDPFEAPTEVWRDNFVMGAEFAAGRTFTNIFTGRKLEGGNLCLSDLFAAFPIAVLGAN